MFLLAPSLEILVFVLMYFLGAATDNENLNPFYHTLFTMNCVVLFSLLLLVIWQFFKLKIRRKTNFFGSSLARKILIFALTLILIPGALFFTISTAFLTKSVEKRVTLEVGQPSHTSQPLLNQVNLSESLLVFNREVAEISSYFSKLSVPQLQKQFSLKAQEHELMELAAFDAKGKTIAFFVSPSKSNETIANQNVTPLSKETLIFLKKNLYFESLVLIDGQLVMRTFYSYVTKTKETYILRVQKYVLEAGSPKKISNGPSESDRGYQGKLVDNYLSSLSLIFAISLLGTISLALAFAEQFTAPLLILSDAAKAIAHGDFSKQNIVTRRDELGSLISVFNQMTIRLKEMHTLAAQRQLELELSKEYVVNILTNLKSGVLTFDNKWFLLLNNQSCEKILGLSFSDFNGVALQDWPRINVALVALIDLITTNSQTNHLQWQQQFSYLRHQGQRLLLIRGSRLSNEGYVIVFDDITELERAQRDAAWGEVAKRLAHEIRNPLMPIQLSAERLALKLSPKLDSFDAAMLIRSTNTIVKQVDALTAMVDAFRSYAKAPMANLSRIYLTNFIKEVMVLYENQSMMKLALIDDSFYIQGDENLLRQVFHNVLQNAQDALAKVKNPVILIESRLFQDYPESQKYIIVSIKDNGQGFNQSILEQAFEPYVTTKPKGTGLGLAMVKKIMEEHGGKVTLANWEESTLTSDMPKIGAIVTLSWPLIS